MATTTTINVGKDFSRYPVGRYLTDGEANGQKFREEFLIRNLVLGSSLIIELDDALGYGSSFLEEAFGGLVRAGFESSNLLTSIQFITDDDSLKEEIVSYIKEAIFPK